MVETKIILLSGKGKRFKDKGYEIPKGMLKINNLELAILSAQSIPKTEKNIFALQKKDDNFDFKTSVKLNCEEESEFFYFNNYTVGQATSCYEILNCYSEYDINSFYVLSCDFSFELSEIKLKKAIENDYEAIAFTTKATDHNYQNAESFGWIRERKNIVEKVSCKELITPKRGSDSIIIGAFYFKNKNKYKEYYLKLLNDKRLVNNETYIDTIIEMMVEDGLKVFNYEVDNFKNFGTPDQFELLN